MKLLFFDIDVRREYIFQEVRTMANVDATGRDVFIAARLHDVSKALGDVSDSLPIASYVRQHLNDIHIDIATYAKLFGDRNV